MKLERRVLFQEQITGLVLVPETEEESRMIDDYLCQPEGCTEKDGSESDGKVRGEVCLADGYGEHYIFLQSDKRAKISDEYMKEVRDKSKAVTFVKPDERGF